MLFALCAMMGAMGMDLYLPSFHAIAAEFKVSAVQVQQSISIYIVAMAITMLFYGSLSDTFGRRRVLVFSIAGYALTALAAAMSPSFTWLLVCRFLQGMMGGSGMVITRAMIQDMYDGAQARRMMALVMMCFGLGPSLAPILGGWLQVYFGWRANFYFLTAFAGLVAVLCWKALPETLTPDKRQPLRLGVIGKNYLQALSHPQFGAMVLGLGFLAGANVLYLIAAAEFVINVLQLEVTSFGWLFVPHIGGTMLGSAVAGWLAIRVPVRLQTLSAYALLLLAVALNLVYNFTVIQPTLPWAVVPIALYSFAIAVLMPIKSVQIISYFPTMKGLASSLQGFTQVFLFAVLSSAVIPLLFHSGRALALGHLVCAVLGLSIWASTHAFKRRPVPGA